MDLNPTDSSPAYESDSYCIGLDCGQRTGRTAQIGTLIDSAVFLGADSNVPFGNCTPYTNSWSVGQLPATIKFVPTPCALASGYLPINAEAATSVELELTNGTVDLPPGVYDAFYVAPGPDIEFTLTLDYGPTTSVPEPGYLGLLAIGAVLVLATRIKKSLPTHP